MTNEDVMQYVTKSIRMVRKEKKVSQIELCLRTGMSQSFLTGIETGKQEPSTMTLIRIAKALNVSPRIFFPADDDESESSFDNKSKNQIKQEIISLVNIL